MNNLRFILAIEVCEEFGFSLFPGGCDNCGYPLMEKPGQMVPFCWFCACDRRAVLVARALLLKMRLAEKGILLEDRHEISEPKPQHYDSGGAFQLGVPL